MPDMKLLVERVHVLPRRKAAPSNDPPRELSIAFVQEDITTAERADGGVPNECKADLFGGRVPANLQRDVIFFEWNHGLWRNHDPQISQITEEAKNTVQQVGQRTPHHH